MPSALIIDDEPRSRQLLAHLLQAYCADVEVLGMAEGLPEGAALARQQPPTVLFLDVSMPRHSGYELLDFFPHIAFEVVYTTAYRSPTEQLFLASGIGYLSKPLQVERLLGLCARLREARALRQSHERLLALRHNLHRPSPQAWRYALPVAEGWHFAELADMARAEAEGAARSRLHWRGGGSLDVLLPFKDLSFMLEGSSMKKENKNLMVNTLAD